MANRLKVAKVFSIKQLYDQGWSQRRIARELEISREAVARHLKEMAESPPAAALADDPNQAKAPLGSKKSEKDSKPAKAPTGSTSETNERKSQ